MAATAAGLQPAGIFRGPGGRFMNEAQMLAASGRGPTIEGSLASAEDAGAAFRAAQAAQVAEVRRQREARRTAGGLPDPDAGGRFGAGLGGMLAALGFIPPAFRGPARVGLSIPGMAIGEAAAGNVMFANPLTGQRLGLEDIAMNARRPMDMYTIPRGGVPPGWLPDSADPDFRARAYGTQRLGAGLGGLGVGAALGRGASAIGSGVTAAEAGTAFKGLATAAAVAGAGIAAGLAVGIGAVAMLRDNAQAAVDAFHESEVAQFRMQFQFQQAGIGANVEEFQRWNEEMAKVIPFDDDALAAAEGILARAFGTPDEIKRYTRLATDLSVVTGRDLSSSAEALVKASAGSTRILKDFGIELDDLADEGEDAASIFGALEQKVGGSAGEFAKTSAAQAEIAKNQFGELTEQVGEYLAPAFTNAQTAMTEFAEAGIRRAGELGDALSGVDTEGLQEGLEGLGNYLSGAFEDAWGGLLTSIEKNDEQIGAFLDNMGYFAGVIGPAVKVSMDLVSLTFQQTALYIGAVTAEARLLFDLIDSRGSFTGGLIQPPTVTQNRPGGGTTTVGPKGPLPALTSGLSLSSSRQVRMHSGGEVTGGAVGQEVWRLLQVGERVTPRGGGGGMPTIVLHADGSSASRFVAQLFAESIKGQGLAVVVR
jgi:hypothetical protein